MKFLSATFVLRWGFVLTALYVVLAMFIPREFFVNLLNGTFIGVVAAVVIMYQPLAWRALKVRQFDRVAQLTIGILLIWLAVITGRILSVISAVVDIPGLFLNSVAAGLISYLAILGAVLHITALDYDETNGAMAGRARRLLIVSAIVAITITLVATFLPSILT